ncbi:MAG TPA: hypothetical protein VIH57_13805 [Bacteroidales bacterium]
MTDKNITAIIGKAILEGKYLNITYKNKNGEVPLLAEVFTSAAHDSKHSFSSGI